MARINGVQQADAGLKVKLVYKFAPRMMKKLTGRESRTGSGIEPMEIWSQIHTPLELGELTCPAAQLCLAPQSGRLVLLRFPTR